MLMVVSNDRFELPMGVFDSVREAAERLNMTEGGIWHALKRNSVTNAMGYKKARFIQLKKMEEEQDG